jgi:hypothetical protein
MFSYFILRIEKQLLLFVWGHAGAVSDTPVSVFHRRGLLLVMLSVRCSGAGWPEHTRHTDRMRKPEVSPLSSVSGMVSRWCPSRQMMMAGSGLRPRYRRRTSLLLVPSDDKSLTPPHGVVVQPR